MAEDDEKLQRALQSLSELQDAYQSTATELDKKAVDVSVKIFPEIPKADSPAPLRQDYHYQISDRWEWTSKLAYCLGVQRLNAQVYHQFHTEAQFVEYTLGQILSWVTSQRERASKDTAKLVTDIKTVMEQLSACQATVDRLYRQAAEVVPVDLRTSPTSRLRRVHALVSYTTNDGAIQENETYLLEDNSDPALWKIRLRDNTVLDVPPIILTIPPPSSGVVLKAQRLRVQLVSTWKISQHSLQRHTRNTLEDYLHSRGTEETEFLTGGQRAEVRKTLSQIKETLRPENEKEPKYVAFTSLVDRWQQEVAAIRDTKPDRQGVGKTMHMDWKNHQKVLKMIQDFSIFADDYGQKVDATRSSSQHVVNKSDVRYVSKAYIERIEPVKTDEVDSPPGGAIDNSGDSSPDHMIIEELLPLVYPEVVENEEVTETQYTETTQEELSSHTLKETKTFSIIGVVDPRNSEQISIYTAINDGIISQTQGLYNNPDTGESMPIPEAMNKGLILVEFVNRSVEQEKAVKQGILTTKSFTETVSYCVKHVRDPATGSQISVAEAIELGIIDQARGRYVNPLTGDNISIADAIDKGFIAAEEVETPVNGTNGHGVIDSDFVILGVADPRTGRHLSLPQAVDSGLVDLEAGTYFDPLRGETVPLSLAVEQGLVRVKLADPVEDRKNPHVVRLTVLQSAVADQQVDKLDEVEGDIIVYDEVGEVEPETLNNRLFDKLKGFIDTSVFGIKEELSGHEYTIEGAFENGVLKLDPVRIENADGEKYTLQDAAAKGLIAPNALRELLSGLEENSIGRLLDSGQLDIETGVYIDPDTNEVLPIAQALSEGLLDPDSVYYIDTPSNTIYPLSCAIENDKFDAETGMIIDPRTGKEVPLALAVEAGIIRSDIDGERIAQRATALKLLNDKMDVGVKGIRDPQTGEELTVEEAVMSGVLDIPHVEMVNHATAEAISLSDAVEEGLIDPETAKQILGTVAAADLQKAIESCLIDPKSGKVIHPETKRKMTVEEAIAAGIFDPYSVFVVDPNTNEIASLGALAEEGRFNQTTGKFRDPLTNLEVSFSNAISKGIVKAKITPEAFISDKLPLEQLLSGGRLNQNAKFLTPDGREVSLKEALKEGLLSPTSVVKVDPRTGHVVLGERPDEEMVRSMMDMNEKLGVVDAVERALAQYHLPVDQPENIHDLVHFHESMQFKLAEEAETVQDILERSLEVLENNKNMSKDPGKQQQYQRLRFNTSDLKVRYQAVNSEVDSRLEKLKSMERNLDDYHGNLATFVDWAEDAERQVKVIKEAASDLDQVDMITPQLKEFTEEALSREAQLQLVAKPANKFLTDVKEYEKGADKFRQGLQEKFDKPERGEPIRIPEEVRDASDQLKSIASDCTTLMAKVTETAYKNKQYADLKDKLSEWLPGIEERVNKCRAEVSPGDDPRNQVEELKSLTTDVIAEGKLVEDLHTVGQDLLAVLEELDCLDTPKAKEIRQVIETVQAKYDEIQESVVDKQHKLNQAVVESQDVYRHLDALADWASHAEKNLSNPPPISLDRAALNEQIQNHMVLCSDIEAHKAQLLSLAEKCRGKEGTEGKLTDIRQRLAHVESLAQDRAVALDDTTKKLGSFHGNAKNLESWLGNAIQALKREASDNEQGSTRDKIENLYRQKALKHKELASVKKTGKELLNNPTTGDKNKLRESLADVQSKWHNLTELLVQTISFAALREIDELLKYLDRAENEINTAEAISTDPETLAVQLRDHKTFHDDLESKRRAVNETIDKCNKMLRETTNEEADGIKNKLDSIRNQADLVCKLSSERLAILEEAVPLASHFTETHADLQAWLGEVEAEIEALEVPGDENVEQIKKHKENAKSTMRIIDDHKPLIEDLNNTGHELMDMCTDEDASDVKEDVDNVNTKYDEVKSAIRAKIQHLDEALRNVTSEVTDTVDGLLEELHYLNDQAEHAEPVASNPDNLREQIVENQTWLDDLSRKVPAIEAVRDGARKMLEQQPPTDEEFEDLRSKLQELDNLQESIQRQTEERGNKLQTAAEVADRFHDNFHDITRALQDVQDNLVSQDAPGIDPATIQEQQRELSAIREEMDVLRIPMEGCKRNGEELSGLCGTPGKMEIQKCLEDLEALAEELDEGVRERLEELKNAHDKAEKFDSTLHGIMTWMPKSESRLKNMGPIAADPRNIRIQMEELKVFKVQVHPHCEDIQNLNQYSSELKTASPLTAESLAPQVKEVNDRWKDILEGIADREKSLKEGLVRLGELDHAMDDVIELLQHTENQLTQLEDVYGDPKFIETHLKKLQLAMSDLKNQESSMKKLNKAVTDTVESSGRSKSPLLEKQEEMNERFMTVQLMARDKQNQLHDILKEIKAFAGEVEDLIHWLNDFRQQLKSSAPLGALPETAQKQFDKFMQKYRDLQKKEDEVNMLLLNGQDMLGRCRDGEAKQLREHLDKMKLRMEDARQKADKKKHRLEEHLQNVKDFHAMLKIHTDWLNNAEKILGTFKHPSKLVERVLKQIQDHKEFRADIEAHRDIMQNLDRTGTYLKYFGRKQDTVYIRNLLMNIKLRWKKLVRRADEKGRILQQACKEDKRQKPETFYDTWRDLCNWIDEHEVKLKKYAAGAPTKVKQDIDELKHFQHQLAQKHPTYYSTMRLGRALKDRCTKSDPERDILQTMLDDLKNKWNIIKSIAAQRQNKLDEALLNSGRFSDAVQSLMEWLSKAEVYLAEDQPILGDLDTINILIEQHKQFQQELESRNGVVQTLRTTPNLDSSVSSQLEDLSNAWDLVTQLSEARSERLNDALKLAEDFNEAVQVVREFLPQAESELKFKQLPENEDHVISLIQQHERFQDELKSHQPNVERIRYLADEILVACHPNAVRFVKYYLTITQTRWEQLTNRANQRTTRLQEALRNLRGQAALTEELLAWLTEAQALLSAKEKDVTPDDLTVVEALVREHLEFHEDLSAKNKDVERLTKLPTTSKDTVKKPSLHNAHGSNTRLNETDSPSQRINTLQNRWRNVWRMSVERKKKLQDSLDHLLELESFKNFDFDLWRQRYMNWIRAKKFRITDFFRRQDKDGDGYILRDEFVEGMLTSKFPTNRTELHAVFDIFDRDGSGQLDYREFVEALKPERRVAPKRNLTDSEMISNEIEQQVSTCQCRQQFKATRIDSGKFKFLFPLNAFLSQSKLME